MSEQAVNLLAPDQVHRNFSLKRFNTFGLEAIASKYYRATSVESLRSCLAIEQPVLVLGGGSNMLLTQPIEGLVLHVDIRGKQVLATKEAEKISTNRVIVEAGAGESWHEFVCWTLDQNLGGLENMSLIPGSVGASPIQNIGAYGVEVKDHFVSLKALNRKTLQEETFSLEDCQFGYRNSIFKLERKGEYIITSVQFWLTNAQHELRMDYGDIQTTLAELAEQPSIHSISKAVIAIRQSKLPDPAEIGNSGSFFKNPEISAAEFEKLKKRRPDVRFYEQADGTVKIPAGWLIDQAGWKGFRRGAIGVHDRQALVLVNHGGGEGAELWALALEIKADIFEKFGIEIEPEVNVI